MIFFLPHWPPEPCDRNSGANENATILTKTGAGTQTLCDAHTFTGKTSIQNGALRITNWSGKQLSGGMEQIFFETDATCLTSGQMPQITFVAPLGKR
jgi:autotransporter-associated beta strand protein